MADPGPPVRPACSTRPLWAFTTSRDGGPDCH
jgi:hypothetical protein